MLCYAVLCYAQAVAYETALQAARRHALHCVPPCPAPHTPHVGQLADAERLLARVQAMVLLKNTILKNDRPALPFAPGGNVVVVGPFAEDASLYLSDYAGGGKPGDPSIAAAVAAANVGGATTSAAGCPVTGASAPADVAKAVGLAAAADAVVLTLGLSKPQEHEGMDRADTLLPGDQYAFAQKVLAAAAGRPLVIVTISGGMVSIDPLLDAAPAVVEAFNPAQRGPAALAALLFGAENRWGKMPITVYPQNYTKGVDLRSMSYTDGPGRSYRYFTGTPVFKFGQACSRPRSTPAKHARARPNLSTPVGSAGRLLHDVLA
jgi:hypothetical protein